MELILTFVQDKGTPEEGFVQFYAPDSRYANSRSEIGPDNAVQLVLAVEEWERLGRPDHFGPITLIPRVWTSDGGTAEPQPVDADGTLIPTPAERPHTLSEDCWCNPGVETVPSYADIKRRLSFAEGVLEDYHMMDVYLGRVEEEEVEANGQAMEP